MCNFVLRPPTTNVAGDASRFGGIPWGSSTLRFVLACTLVLPLGGPLISPALPVVRDAFGLTDARASLLLTVYFLPGAVLAPLAGTLADRVGRRRVLGTALVVFGLAGSAVTLEPPYGVVLALRAVQGISTAGAAATTVTLLGDAFDGVQRNAAMGVNVAVLSTARTLYPTVGGALAAIAWRFPFATYVLAVPVGVAVLLALDPQPIQDADESTSVRRLVATLSTRATAGLYGAALLVEIVGFGAVFGALPFVLTARGLSPLAVGIVLGTATMTSAIVAGINGRLAARVANRDLVVASILLVGVGVVGTSADRSVAIAVGAVLVGAGLGLLLPSLDAELASVAPPAVRGGTYGVRISISYLGRASGPILFTLLGAAVGYPTALLGGGGLALIAGAGAAIARR